MLLNLRHIPMLVDLNHATNSFEIPDSDWTDQIILPYEFFDVGFIRTKKKKAFIIEETPRRGGKGKPRDLQRTSTVP